jgi:hypothetical protein
MSCPVRHPSTPDAVSYKDEKGDDLADIGRVGDLAQSGLIEDALLDTFVEPRNDGPGDGRGFINRAMLQVLRDRSDGSGASSAWRETRE